MIKKIQIQKHDIGQLRPVSETLTIELLFFISAHYKLLKTFTRLKLLFKAKQLKVKYEAFHDACPCQFEILTM